VRIGQRGGTCLENRAGLFGGAMLILIGFRILLL